MIDGISFGAKFDVSVSGYEDRMRFSTEGLGSGNIAKLSAELDSQTPKDYKMVLAFRDRNREEDYFVLRKKTGDDWRRVADYTTQPMSRRGMSIERLLGIFNILKLKETQALEVHRLENRLEAMKVRHKKEYNEAVKKFDIDA